MRAKFCFEILARVRAVEGAFAGKTVEQVEILRQRLAQPRAVAENHDGIVNQGTMPIEQLKQLGRGQSPPDVETDLRLRRDREMPGATPGRIGKHPPEQVGETTPRLRTAASASGNGISAGVAGFELIRSRSLPRILSVLRRSPRQVRDTAVQKARHPNRVPWVKYGGASVELSAELPTNHSAQRQQCPFPAAGCCSAQESIRRQPRNRDVVQGHVARIVTEGELDGIADRYRSR